MSGAAGGRSPRAHHSTLHGFGALSAPWLGRWKTRGAILLLLALTAMQMALAVGYNLWNARLFDALERRDVAALWQAVWQFLFLLAAITASNAAQLAARRGVSLSWRRALTTRLLAAWLDDGRHWRLGQMAGSPDNPDGRIAEDIRIATEQGVELVSSLFFAVTTLLAFIGILWALSGEITVFGIPVHGHMVWLALLYATGGAVAAYVLGRPLTRATEQRQRAEADLRYGLARAREHDEELVVARGEAVARADLLRRFGALALTWRLQTFGLRNLTAFSSAFVTVAPILPLLVSAPRYLAGTLSLGGLMQLAQGFQQAVAAMSWPVDNAARLAEWRASADRILVLSDAIDLSEAEAGGLAVDETGAALVLSGLVLRQPDGTALSASAEARLSPGDRAEVTGDPRAVRALFLAIAGFWPWGEGRILRPPGQGVAMLPRRPWLPEASLARLLEPPGGAPREAMAAVLGGVGLADLVARLEEEADWEVALDETDRLRLGFARLLLARPGMVLLGDLAGQLGEEELRRLIGILSLALPQAIVLSADHGALAFEKHLALAPPVDLPQGRAAHAAARQRAFQLVDWLRRGFGHGAE
jgi:putative ATP-binding cassette transporter